MKTQLQRQWLAAAKDMRNRFATDYRNQKGMADPWWRTAHSMVQAWRIRASQPRHEKQTSDTREPRTWKAAALKMKKALDCQAKQQSLKGSWKYWATQRAQFHCRYIPKRHRL
jgi:hypothetical protein